MLRLFAILEQSIEEFALKLACAAPYTNGLSPIGYIRCNSLQDANYQMISIGRRRPIRYTKWTRIDFIEDNIKHVLDISDFFYSNLQNHSVLINEMRVVRNHIAHRSKSTANEYNSEMRRIYGANPRLTVGAFLISTSRNPLANINRYLRSAKIILVDAIKGS